MHRVKVLVVDDDDDLREMFAELGFDRKHHAVFQAANGKKAQAIIQRARPPVDIVVTDHDMPEMNGTELINWIKKYRPETFVILASGRPIQHPLADRNVFKLDLLKVLPGLLKELKKIGRVMKQEPKK